MKRANQNQLIVPVDNNHFPISEDDLDKNLKQIKINKPTVIFFGNTKYSLIGGDIINQTFDISLVVTKPDSPTLNWAKENGLLTLETTKLDEEAVQEIAQYEPDFLIVEDYSLILPEPLLQLPKEAALNIHHSLLPKFRGPSPAPAAILAGEKITGVSVIKMTKRIDAGDILGQVETPLLGTDTTDSLLTKLNQLGGELIVKVLTDFDKITPQAQDESKASYSKMMSKEDSYFEIDSPPSSEMLQRMIRAYYPWPGVWTKWNNKVVKFLPGGLVQMEGKKATDLKSFLNGYPEFPLKSI